MHRRYESFLSTAFFRDGDFFCVDSRGIMGVFSPKDNSWKVLEEPHEQRTFGSRPGFLVECGGDLLLVKLEHHGRSIRISRLNFSEMEWVKVESLEEYVLFISHTSCVSAVAPNNYMKNKVYFPRLHLNDGGILFYSLETCSYHTLGSQHSADDTEGCTWIEPNSSVSTSEELDWLKKPFQSE
ncbi:F-box/kelch-repeat protein At1g57790-like [Papaver somniferum]|uniref:F-box/kelch-repeat protein At1g57790-like n=1 Tax=Papaver somniferum TaxID=3469 RepID=UPI000E7030C8|nr:F-box/kelch-repeat protein At1g57790-like [Papaver somniferum]